MTGLVEFFHKSVLYNAVDINLYKIATLKVFRCIKAELAIPRTMLANLRNSQFPCRETESANLERILNTSYLKKHKIEYAKQIADSIALQYWRDSDVILNAVLRSNHQHQNSDSAPELIEASRKNASFFYFFLFPPELFCASPDRGSALRRSALWLRPSATQHAPRTLPGRRNRGEIFCVPGLVGALGVW